MCGVRPLLSKNTSEIAHAWSERVWLEKPCLRTIYVRRECGESRHRLVQNSEGYRPMCGVSGECESPCAKQPKIPAYVRRERVESSCYKPQQPDDDVRRNRPALPNEARFLRCVVLCERVPFYKTHQSLPQSNYVSCEQVFFPKKQHNSLQVRRLSSLLDIEKEDIERNYAASLRFSKNQIPITRYTCGGVNGSARLSSTRVPKDQSHSRYAAGSVCLSVSYPKKMKPKGERVSRVEKQHHAKNWTDVKKWWSRRCCCAIKFQREIHNDIDECVCVDCNPSHPRLYYKQAWQLTMFVRSLSVCDWLLIGGTVLVDSAGDDHHHQDVEKIVAVACQ
ncbi:hypothetical protein BDV95DRAFT_285908 [Massariosphaeria phaeospora]|uniref:Uncharacterized protein n=1 Tax=Massariosphaeria phaeospora TaxID=100035 RepID=A0A7C8MEU4_9PLEO|nr:hypothetical protein BDV95DRAFT_285908 [Massariosphaeria phaeospora]